MVGIDSLGEEMVWAQEKQIIYRGAQTHNWFWLKKHKKELPPQKKEGKNKNKHNNWSENEVMCTQGRMKPHVSLRDIGYLY